MHLQDTSEVDGLRELNLSNKVRRAPRALCALPAPYPLRGSSDAGTVSLSM